MSKPTIYVYHDSGDYLGILVERRNGLVFFDGPRTRDGHPVKFATVHETRLSLDGPDGEVTE